VFNYRLSRARRIVENAFGLLASVFRIFRKPLIVRPPTTNDITLACVYLHNFLRRNSAPKQLHTPPGTLDFENTDNGTVIEGQWRREIQNDSGMVNLAKTLRNHGNGAKKIRDAFLDYFTSNEGRVSWQDNICSTSYVTKKNPNTYAYQTFLMCCYCVFSFPFIIILQDKKHMFVRKPA